MSDDRLDQFAALYRERRFDDQRGWYDSRIDEYRRAHDQIVLAIAGALFVASVAGALAGGDVAGARTLWAVLAALASGTATVLGGYDSLIGYEQNAKIYRDARAALARLGTRAPWVSPAPHDAAALDRFVAEVEGVFDNEMHHWGQLTAAYAPPSEEADAAES